MKSGKTNTLFLPQRKKNVSKARAPILANATTAMLRTTDARKKVELQFFEAMCGARDEDSELTVGMVWLVVIGYPERDLRCC